MSLELKLPIKELLISSSYLFVSARYLKNLNTLMHFNLMGCRSNAFILITYSKACDCVNHTSLLSKLRSLVHLCVFASATSSPTNLRELWVHQKDCSVVLYFSNYSPMVYTVPSSLIIFFLMTTLQKHLNALVTWSNNNGLDLNIPKCSVVTFSRAHNPIKSEYCINNVVLAGM